MILILIAGISQIMNLRPGGIIILNIFPFFSALILYTVLQIRKNDKSCWEQLS